MCMACTAHSTQLCQLQALESLASLRDGYGPQLSDRRSSVIFQQERFLINVKGNNRPIWQHLVPVARGRFGP